MLDLAIFVITSFVAARASSKSSSAPPPWPIIPGGLPIMGHLLLLRDSDQFWNTLQSWAKFYGSQGNGGIFEFSLFRTRWIVLCQTDPIMKVMGKRPYKVRRASKQENILNVMGVGGLFSAEGERWKIERRIMAPMLNNKNVTSYFPSIKLIASRLIEKWSNESVVTVNVDSANCALDVVSLSLLGQDLNSLSNPTKLESRDVFNIFHILMARNLSPIPYWKIPLIGKNIDGGGPALDRVLKSIQRLVKDCQEKQQQQQQQQQEKKKQNVDNNKGEALEKKEDEEKTTLLQKLVIQNNDEQLPEDRMVGNLFTLILAGTDTSGMTITSCLWEIANDTSGLQDEIANEISKLLLGANNSNNNKLLNDLSMDDILNGTPRLMSLYYEILRLRGPGPYFFLEPTESFELRDGEIVTPGTILVTMNGYLRGTKQGKGGSIVSEVPTGPSGESPEEFCPRRWLVTRSHDGEQKVAVQTPSNKFGGFMAFGHGVRICPGRYLAEVEILTMLTYVLGTFEIAVEKDHPPRKLVTRFTETFDGDIRLTLKPRKVLNLISNR